MILFNEIFQRAINLFDDPALNRAYLDDPVKFSQTMRPFLINGRVNFKRPMLIASALSTYTDPLGKAEVFEGNGGAVYVLASDNTPVNNSVMSFKIDGQPAIASYDDATKTATFEHPVEIGHSCSVSWYYAGEFTADLSSLFIRYSDYYIDMSKNILAQCLCIAWAGKNRNFLLEIKNLMTDTEFKTYSSANALDKRIVWYNSLVDEVKHSITSLGWALKNDGGSRVG